MEALHESLATTAGPLLVAGCAMIALGATAVVTVAMLWWKRRQPDTPPAEPARVGVDRYDAPKETTAVASLDARRLQHIDRRLDDLETQIAALTDRVETVLRPRATRPEPAAEAARTRRPEVRRVDDPPPTPEELSLRALVARAH